MARTGTREGEGEELLYWTLEELAAIEVPSSRAITKPKSHSNNVQYRYITSQQHNKMLDQKLRPGNMELQTPRWIREYTTPYGYGAESRKDGCPSIPLPYPTLPSSTSLRPGEHGNGDGSGGGGLLASLPPNPVSSHPMPFILPSTSGEKGWQVVHHTSLLRLVPNYPFVTALIHPYTHLPSNSPALPFLVTSSVRLSRLSSYLISSSHPSRSKK
ncbi:uncharacterized protein CLUP02_06029 [Colletotrichum lupini]|uniref:Uncharacterized protein n=1 Tax=Colletotrichum lupini TaxID=145971 RepID=A0A9Q8SPH4_9PEZI|nr:uncharacterized protein CLUP02_06029 [Colletotrichum lupini]UQC80546.1 hypothetical protein CLUP02_06029 [Colletotrichum lupini]